MREKNGNVSVSEFVRVDVRQIVFLKIHPAKVKPCLHSNVEYALKGLDFAGMRGQLEKAIWNKPAWHGNLDAVHRSQAGRNMNQIGG